MRNLEQSNYEVEERGDLKPWEDGFGLLPVTKLREVSQNWSAEIWEEYLQTLEVEPEPFLVDKYDDALRSYGTDDVQEEEPMPCTDFAALTDGMKNLPPMEQTVIRSIFWNGMSDREVAELLGTSRRVVMNIKNEALKRLKAQVSYSDTEQNNVRDLKRAGFHGAGFSETVIPSRIAVNQAVYQ